MIDPLITRINVISLESRTPRRCSHPGLSSGILRFPFSIAKKNQFAGHVATSFIRKRRGTSRERLPLVTRRGRVDAKRKGPHLADWPRGSSFACRGFRLLYELTVERHIRHGRRFAFQAVSEKAIVNDRWTSNGQHVLHTTTHKTYAYVSAAPEKKSPFCLNERARAPASPPTNACATSAFLFAVRRGKYTSRCGDRMLP